MRRNKLISKTLGIASKGSNPVSAKEIERNFAFGYLLALFPDISLRVRDETTSVVENTPTCTHIKTESYPADIASEIPNDGAVVCTAPGQPPVIIMTLPTYGLLVEAKP